MSWLQRYFPQTIAGRLSLWFLLAALIPSVILSSVFYAVSRNAMEAQVYRGLNILLENRIKFLDTYADERKREVDVLTKAPAVINAMKSYLALESNDPAERTNLDNKTQAVFRGFLDSLGYPNALLVTSPQMQTNDSNPDLTVAYRHDSGFEVGENLKKTFSNSELYKAVAAAVSVDTPTLSTPDFYPRINGTDGVPLIFTAETILDPVEKGIDGKPKRLGILVFQLNPREFQAIFEDYQGLGESGESKSVRKIGGKTYLLTSLRGDGGIRKVKREIENDSLRGEAARKAAELEATPDRRGQGEVLDLAGNRSIAAWGFAPVMGAGVVTKFSLEEAFSKVNLLWLLTLGLLGLTALMTIPAALWAARSFSAPIVEAASFTKLVSEGDLTQQITRQATGEVGTLLNSVDDMSQQLRKLIKHFQESIITVMSTSNEISAAARQQEKTVQEHRSSTVEVAAAVNQISATTGQLLKTMTDVQNSAVHAGELAETGQKSLGGMHHAMMGLAESTGSIGSRLSVISERANNINLAVTTITKVADQTNLLSINAAIEAEKAGEAGRGFLVVAREIRRLADQTAAATLDIERIVKEMQQSVTAGVMEMDKFNEQVRKGVEEVGQIGNSLGEVIGSVQELLPQFQHVSEGMSAQSQGADQIREAMAHLSEGSTITSESIRESHRASELLRDAIGRLRDDISQFKT